MESVIAELGYAVLSRFQNLQVLYSNSAETLKGKGDPELVIERYMDAITAEEVKNSPSQISEKARNEIEVQLKALSNEKPVDDLSSAEKASRQKAAPQTKIPLAVKLPPDQAVLERAAAEKPALPAPAPAVVEKKEEMKLEMAPAPTPTEAACPGPGGGACCGRGQQGDAKEVADKAEAVLKSMFFSIRRDALFN